MRILVVGGAGFVGSTSVETFVEAGHDVVVYDDLSSGHASAVVRPARLVRRRRSRTRRTCEHVLRDERIDAVLHCAAKSLVGESMADPGLYYRNNVGGGVALLEAMRADRRQPAGLLAPPPPSTASRDASRSPSRTGPSRSTRTGRRSSPSRAPCAGSRQPRLPGHQPALLQRRRRDRAQRRGPRSGDAPHAAHAAGGRRRGDARPDLRAGLPDPGRDLHPRLHPRPRPGRAPTCARWR